MKKRCDAVGGTMNPAGLCIKNGALDNGPQHMNSRDSNSNNARDINSNPKGSNSVDPQVSKTFLKNLRV